MGAARKLHFDPPDAEQRLGEPAHLAIFAAEQYHARSFFGRHPVLTFLVGPLPLLWLGLVIVGILFFGTGVVMEGIDWVWSVIFDWPLSSIPEENHPYVQGVALAVMCWIALVLPPLFAGSVLCRVAARNGLHWKWPVLGCGLLAVVSGFSWASYRIKTIDSAGTFMIGFQFSSSVSMMLATFLPKFALAMAIGLLLVKRSQDRLAAIG